MRYTPIIPQRLNPIKDFNKVLSVGEYFTAKDLPDVKQSAQNLLRWLAENVLEVDKWGDPNLSGMPRLYREKMVEMWTKYDTKIIEDYKVPYTKKVKPYLTLKLLLETILKEENRFSKETSPGMYWLSMYLGIYHKNITALTQLKNEYGELTPEKVREKNTNLNTNILGLYDKDQARWYDTVFSDFQDALRRQIAVSPYLGTYQDMLDNSPLKSMFEWLAKHHGGSWPKKIITVVETIPDINQIDALDTWKKQVQKWRIPHLYPRLFDDQPAQPMAQADVKSTTQAFTERMRARQPIQEEVARTLDRPLTEAEREKINYLIGYNYGLEAICAIIQNKEVQKKILGFCSD
jgi:hypothetical protein